MRGTQAKPSSHIQCNAPVLPLAVREGPLEVGVKREEDEGEGDVAGQRGEGALVHAPNAQALHHLLYYMGVHDTLVDKLMCMSNTDVTCTCMINRK